MKTCHVCGAQVDDKELICPDCGATVVGSTGGFALKPQEPQKKKASNPMGMTVSTGSGLTDLLRAEDEDVEVEDELGGGSIPLTYAQNVIDDDAAYKEKRLKQKQKKFIARAIVIIAICIFAFVIISGYLKQRRGADTPDTLMDIYVEAVNDGDVDKMASIMPSYLDEQAEAQKLIDNMKGAHVNTCEIVRTVEFSQQEMEELQDSIKYQTGRTANIKGATLITVKMSGTANRGGIDVTVNTEFDIQLVKLKKGIGEYYFIHMDTYDNPDFNYR